MMKKIRTFCFVAAFFCVCVVNAFADYPYTGACPASGVYVTDMWNFYKCECVSYVAWKINQSNEQMSIMFSNSYQDEHWGSAYNWKSLAAQETYAHYSKNVEYMDTSSPSYPFKSYGNGGVFDVRYAVAWWNSSDNLPVGHVAYTDSTTWNPDHTVNHITVSEYNFSSPGHTPGSRNLYPGNSDYPDGFLYFSTDTYLECELMNMCTGSGGSGGGGGGSPSLPDFIIRNIWLSDSAGHAKTVFRPGEAMQIHIEVKNTGTDTASGIDVDYFRSNGFHKDSNPTNVGTDFIHKDDLGGGETHSELKNTTAPTTKGTYNMTAQADSGHDVDEEHESNNWSDEAVFKVTDLGWLVPIRDYILQ